MADQTEFTEYTTKAGDRWDMVAFFAYGDPFKYRPVMAANPALLLSAVLPAGIKVLVPIIQTQTAGTITAAQLPPWKQLPSV